MYAYSVVHISDWEQRQTSQKETAVSTSGSNSPLVNRDRVRWVILHGFTLGGAASYRALHQRIARRKNSASLTQERSPLCPRFFNGFDG